MLGTNKASGDADGHTLLIGAGFGKEGLFCVDAISSGAQGPYSSPRSDDNGTIWRF